jgi:hypothetical protein
MGRSDVGTEKNHSVIRDGSSPSAPSYSRMNTRIFTLLAIIALAFIPGWFFCYSSGDILVVTEFITVAFLARRR